eukprot:162858-Chlamydomonas_euryale.AAC.5
MNESCGSHAGRGATCPRHAVAARGPGTKPRWDVCAAARSRYDAAVLIQRAARRRSGRRGPPRTSAVSWILCRPLPYMVERVHAYTQHTRSAQPGKTGQAPDLSCGMASRTCKGCTLQLGQGGSTCQTKPLT